MKRALLLLASILLLGAGPGRAVSAQALPEPPKTHLAVGDTAPDFTMLDDTWEPVTLSSFRGEKNVILAFYVLAFTGG
jgi:hypothetical protein